jgi:hypothetical protein
MPANYVLIERITLNATAASVVLDNIPQTGYTDLKIVVSARTARSSLDDGLIMRFNNEANQTNISGREIYGTGSSALSATTSESGYINGNTSTANTFASIEIYIPNAFGSTTKSFFVDGAQENNATAALTNIRAMLWNQTASINKLTFLSSTSNNFLANSEFSIYGIAALGTTPTVLPKASGGDIVVNDGTYWIHTFLSSGVFIPNQALTCDYLVVAGGGGGGYGYGGGGGAGGYRNSTTGELTGGGGSAETSLSVTAIPYAVTVGAGGPSRVAIGGLSGGYGGSGNNSVFSSVTSTGGGGGGFVGNAGLTGGSGGGGGGTGGTPNAAGGARTASPVQGFDGGSANDNGGGGGGAGATGVFASMNGGAGLSSSINGTATFRAGGGGGNISTSQGGNGGGGAVDVSGSANTGGGGGSQNGNGGSGIVIVRYTMA